jgi:peptide chain release factor 1
MRELLEAKLARLAELEQAMADPELTNDMQRFTAMNREYAELRDIAAVSKPYLGALDEIEGAKNILETESDADMRELAKEELKLLEDSIPEFESKIENLLLPRDPDDSRDAVLEIRAGAGGEEAALFAQEVARMYQRYAERKGWKLEMISVSDASAGGLKEAIFTLRGRDAYGHLRYESGVHRVQRVPATESQGRIHTSAVSVVVMPEAEEVDAAVNTNDLRIDVYRASGAGGQHVNTTDSAVRITHLPTGLVVTCQDERSQHKNKTKALKVLATRLYDKLKTEQHDAEAAERKSQVGSGDRSAKIRTYNFPQSRITDHRIGFTTHALSETLDGSIDEFVEKLMLYYREAMRDAMNEVQ